MRDLDQIKELDKFCVSQLKSVKYARKVLDEFFKKPRHESLNVLKNVSGYELGAKLCLASALATGVNFVFDQRLFGNDGEDSLFKVGDFYKIMLPHHSVGSTGLPVPNDKGWWVITKTGDVYHHAAIAFLRLFGLRVVLAFGFSDIEQLLVNAENKKIGLMVSLENRFILKRSFEGRGFDYAQQPSRVLIDGKEKDFGSGTHIISVFGVDAGEVIAADTFYPTDSFKDPVFKIKKEILNGYLRQPAHAIVFSREKIELPAAFVKEAYIPESVSRKLGNFKIKI